MEFVSIVNNEKKSEDEALLTESALSLLIRVDGKSILVDTGSSSDGRAFLENSKHLGISLEEVDICIISHWHFDHIGGLRSFLEANSHAKVYLRKHPLEKKLYVKIFLYRKDVGPPDYDVFENFKDRIVFCDEDVTKVSESVSIVCCTANTYSRPHCNWMLKTYDASRGYQDDDFQHENFVVVHPTTSGEMVVFSPCSHCGIANICESAVAKFPERKLTNVVGGFHFFVSFVSEPREAVLDIADALSKYENCQFYTMHCTGLRAFNILKERLGDAVNYVYCGERKILQDGENE